MYTLILTITKPGSNAPDAMLAVPGFPSRSAAEAVADTWVRNNQTKDNSVSAIVAPT